MIFKLFLFGGKENCIKVRLKHAPFYIISKGTFRLFLTKQLLFQKERLRFGVSKHAVRPKIK